MKTWVEIGVAIHDLRGHIDTITTQTQAAKRAVRGEEPYPSRPSVESALRKLEDATRRVDGLARTGLGAPAGGKVGLEDVANPATRPRALATFRDDVAEREQFVAEGHKIVADLEGLAREAPLRATALREMRDFFRGLVEAPLPFGTAFQAEAFGYYQLFERASGRMASLGHAATRALERIRPELARHEEEVENLRANLVTFGVL